MKRIRRLIFPVILLLAAVALLWVYWVRPAGSLATAWNNLLNPPALSATALTASGTVEMTEINVAPEAAGKILAVDVKEGDTVHVGDELAQLDDTLLKDQRAIAASSLETAKIALTQLTSPATIASLQSAIAQDKQNIDNAQQAYDNQRTFTTNQSAVRNAEASLVLAQKALSDAQTDYNKVAGNPDNNTDKANAYQKLNASQTAFNTANYNGPVIKTPSLNCNVTNQSTVVMQLKGTVYKPYDVIPPVAVLNLMPDAENASAVVTITNQTEEPLMLAAPESNNRMFAAELKTNVLGKGYELTISTVPPLGMGNVQGARLDAAAHHGIYEKIEVQIQDFRHSFRL